MGKASACSRFIFSWSFPIVKRAKAGEQLKVTDFGGLREDDRVIIKSKQLMTNYSQMKNKSLVKAIFKTFKIEFIFAFLLCLVGTCFSFLSPFLINWILTFLENRDTDTKKGMYYLAYLVTS